MSSHPSLDLSVCIITLNEEDNLGRCLSSLPTGVEIIVLDSGSIDGTRKVADSFGAQVHHRDFTNYAEQKNAAIQLATRAWVFSLDADEVLEQGLKEALTAWAEKPDRRYAAMRVSRSLVFMNRRMRFGKTNDQPLRLFARQHGQFEGAIHEEVRVDGEVGLLGAGLHACGLLHYSYDNLTDYFDRFNSYTSKIAQQKKTRGLSVSPLHVLRPWWEFIERYVLRLGFLDGYPGYCYAVISSFYTFIKYAKLKELKNLN